MKKRQLHLEVNENYAKISDSYDFQIKLYNLFWQIFGFRYEFWRKIAINSLEVQEGNIVLDLGCGSGLNFNQIYKMVGANGSIFGVDNSEQMINLAQKKVHKNRFSNTRLIKMDMETFETDLQFNSIISTYAIEFSKNPKKVIQKSFHCLKPRGRLVLLSFKNDNLSLRTKLFLPFWQKCVRDYPQKDLIQNGKIIRDSLTQFFPESHRTEFFGGLVCLDVGIKK